MAYNPLNPNGQATMANSQPVVLASDQASVPVAATLSAETTKVVGVVRNADGSGNLLTSTTNALDINIKTGNPTTIAVTQATASSLNAQVVGAGAAGASLSGNPVRLGGLGRTTLPTSVSSAQLVDFLLDRYGRVYVVKPVVSNVSSAGTPITTNTNTSIITAPSAGNHLRIHKLWAQNSSTTGTWCYWGNGSGVKTIPFYLAQYQPFSISLDGGWELSTATALFMNTATTGANIEWFVEYETLTD